jgi:oligopeptidase B
MVSATPDSPTAEAGTNAAGMPTPPIARRDESRTVLAGVAPPGWKEDLPRQSECSTEPLLDPPVAIADPYGWLRDESREVEEVLEHLNAENAYTETLTKHLDGLRTSLYNEMLSGIQETDFTTPGPKKDYYYYTRTFEGKSYTVHCRAPRKSNEDNPKLDQWDKAAESLILEGEEVTLDVNELAKGKKYCCTGSVTHSPSQKFLAYSADFTGGETCLMFVKNMDSEEVVDHDPTLEMSGKICWGADDNTLFYMALDAAHRPYKVFRLKLGSNEPDEMLLEESDDMYWMHISKSLDGKFLFVESSSTETSEVHFLDLTNPTATLECIAKRRTKVLYDVEHREGQWWITSNFGGLPNMALWAAPAEANCEDSWTLVLGEDGVTPLFDGGSERSLDYVSCFSNHVAALGREGGLPRIWVAKVDKDDGTITKSEMLSFAEDAYDVGLGSNYEYDTGSIVMSYDSLVTPPQSLQVNLDNTNERTVLKQRSVPGYDKELYGCDRFTVKSRDGATDIPVSMVYRKDTMEQHESSGEPVPLHLYGYGSYGACIEADFRSTRLPLLDRGIVYVIAHIRGGGEMGRQWYEEPNGAKYLCKKNTFNDFVDVGRWLVDVKKLTTSDQMSCEGRSAGGLLIGASINQAPDLFRMAIMGVPFVDVVPTMVDASIPLTAVEWEEWGNPNEVKYHKYMMEYSPIQNVQPNTVYPACLLTGGLHDPRVQFWEPTKFAAELRHVSSSSNPICVKLDMSAGHFSASDRYKYLKELSFDYAFLLDQLGIADVKASKE